MRYPRPSSTPTMTPTGNSTSRPDDFDTSIDRYGHTPIASRAARAPVVEAAGSSLVKKPLVSPSLSPTCGDTGFGGHHREHSGANSPTWLGSTELASSLTPQAGDEVA